MLEAVGASLVVVDESVVGGDPSVLAAPLLAAVVSTAAARPDVADDVYLYPFPMWHVAIYNVLCHLLAGRPVVVHARVDPVTLVDEVGRHGVTSMSLAAGGPWRRPRCWRDATGT